MPPTRPTEEAWLLTQDGVKATLFPTTLWSTVLAAGKEPSTDSEAALGRLCEIYWPAVYAYVRKRAVSTEQAQDLTQSFFARFLEKNYITRAQRDRGRFRSFLLTSVEHFLCDEYDRATSLKRGGGLLPLSLDTAILEAEQEPVVAMTPALAFEKLWARTLLNQVMQQLRQAYQASGRAHLFEQLQSHLWGEAGAIPYEDLSKLLGIAVVHLRVSAHRMRQRFREILREEIAQTVSSPDEIDDEIRYLLRVVSSYPGA